MFSSIGVEKAAKRIFKPEIISLTTRESDQKKSVLVRQFYVFLVCLVEIYLLYAEVTFVFPPKYFYDCTVLYSSLLD